MGPGGFFPSNPDLPDILGRTGLDFENLYFLIFFGVPNFWLGPTWAQLGPTHLGPSWAHPLWAHPLWAPRGPTWAPRRPTHLGPLGGPLG